MQGVQLEVIMHQIDIDIKNISKTEGHTDMFIGVDDGKVTRCELKISENARFFKKALEGLHYSQVPFKVSRICGTCSSAHMFCAIEAIEKALGIVPTHQTFKLRRLLMNGSHLRDHAMHLWFFCLPDIFGVDSIFDFNEQQKEYIHDGLEAKDAGSFLATIIGGRAVHPPFAVVGGFTKFPTVEQMKEAIEKLENSRKKILKIIDIFYKDKRSFEREANYVAIVNSDYNYLEGNIKTAKGTVIEEKGFRKHLEEVVLPYSTANAFTWESKDYLVGALARINLNKESLHSHTRADCDKVLRIFPNNCVFNNNTAQAIECLHAVDLSIDILEDLIKNLKVEKPATPKKKEGLGVGVIEAPRGTLYYKLEIDWEGKIKFAELIIPTQQNIKHLEKDVAKYVEELIAKETPKEEISLKVEEMIRAYDPCMSCATHFLKIKWS